MAVASVENNYLLNAWPRVMLESEWHFNQVEGKGAPLNNGCSVYTQIQREPIARALDTAVKKFADIMRFWPRPKYFQDIVPLGRGYPFQNQAFHTEKSMKLIEFGTRATTLVQANAPVAYSDPHVEGIDTLATVTVAAGALTSTDEIQIFFRVADGAKGAADERYQIEPTTVTLTGGNFVITAPRWLFVRPFTIWDVPFELTDPNRKEINAADTQNVADFVTEVDVYRVYTDTTTQVEVMNHNNDTVLATFSGVIDSAELGIYVLHHTCCNFIASCRYPVRLRVNYRAGEALSYGAMDTELEEAIIRLANTLTPEKYCRLCDRVLDRWTQDNAYPTTTANQVVLTPGQQAVPWGALQGALYAWEVAIDRRLTRNGKLTMNRRW